MDLISRERRRSEQRKINGKRADGITARSTENSGKNRGLANLRPFKKGQSGNPGGRPKKLPMSEIYEEIFADPKMRADIKKQTHKTLSSPGMAGVLERREAADRLEGKVTQEMQIDVNLTLAEKMERAEQRSKCR